MAVFAPPLLARHRPSDRAPRLTVSALAIDSSPTLRRIRRLLRLEHPLTRHGHALAVAATTVATVLPVALLAVSGAALFRPCPPDTDGGWSRWWFRWTLRMGAEEY